MSINHRNKSDSIIDDNSLLSNCSYTILPDDMYKKERNKDSYSDIFIERKGVRGMSQKGKNSQKENKKIFKLHKRVDDISIINKLKFTKENKEKSEDIQKAITDVSEGDILKNKKLLINDREKEKENEEEKEKEKEKYFDLPLKIEDNLYNKKRKGNNSNSKNNIVLRKRKEFYSIKNEEDDNKSIEVSKEERKNDIRNNYNDNFTYENEYIENKEDEDIKDEDIYNQGYYITKKKIFEIEEENEESYKGSLSQKYSYQNQNQNLFYDSNESKNTYQDNKTQEYKKSSPKPIELLINSKNQKIHLDQLHDSTYRNDIQSQNSNEKNFTINDTYSPIIPNTKIHNNNNYCISSISFIVGGNTSKKIHKKSNTPISIIQTNSNSINFEGEVNKNIFINQSEFNDKNLFIQHTNFDIKKNRDINEKIYNKIQIPSIKQDKETISSNLNYMKNSLLVRPKNPPIKKGSFISNINENVNANAICATLNNDDYYFQKKFNLNDFVKNFRLKSKEKEIDKEKGKKINSYLNVHYTPKPKETTKKKIKSESILVFNTIQNNDNNSNSNNNNKSIRSKKNEESNNNNQNESEHRMIAKPKIGFKKIKRLFNLDKNNPIYKIIPFNSNKNLQLNPYKNFVLPANTLESVLIKREENFCKTNFNI